MGISPSLQSKRPVCDATVKPYGYYIFIIADFGNC